ncbi:MAG: gamma-glutamyltransferase family protein [Turicibacter sp.]|nr:gamma-glutamyltransferase family protein [Turicibacter sp.]
MSCQVLIIPYRRPTHNTYTPIVVSNSITTLFYKGGVFLFNPNFNPYPSHRNVVYGNNGIVATSQSLAAQAGLRILQQGGNAIDAAIATAACLTVVEPTSNGIGGDAFALVWTKGKLHGLNASGPAPKNISIEKVMALGHEKMPQFGWLPVTVPGVPAAWAALSKRFGKLPFGEVLNPAIEYSKRGFPVSPTVAYYWDFAFGKNSQNPDKETFTEWLKTFAPHGRAPRVGEIWKSGDHSRTLEEIAKTGSESFYRGELAEKIAEASQKAGGFLTAQDLSDYEPEWVEPIKVNYRGYDVWELPPNGQGIIALSALNILKEFDFASKDTAETIHKQIEAIKLAFSAASKAISDPGHMNPSHVPFLLSETFADRERERIGEKAIEPVPGSLPKGGTVYLCTADGEGNMVSFIQSNYWGFGSGIVVPGTGISMQNRGYEFSLDPAHPNALMGGKKPYHTIIPGFLSKDGEAVGPFGVMGGYMQPQGHVQLLMNTIDFKLNPQMALDAPRFQWTEGKTVEVEYNFPKHVAEELAAKGHDIRIALNAGGFGRGQIIWRDPLNGVLAGGCDSRSDSAVAAF